ncbi:MAG: hypothetical protein IRY97_09420, partial [Thermomicrobiaceae bacterium]|nr:hypothetical protein [Thermomicrobiaceae bacterium]
VYTESLFLLLTVAAVYLGRTERWGRAGVAACLATLTHDTGVLVLIPLGLFLVRRWGWDPRRWWRQALPLLAVPLAPLPFLWYLDRLWGDPLLPLHAHHERMWSRAWAPPWTTLARAVEKVDLSWLGALAASPDWHTLASPDLRQRFAVSRSYELVVTLALAPLLAYALARLRPAYSLYALARYALPLVIPSAYNPLMSTPRLVVVVFPLFIALALLLRRRWLFGAALALFALQLVGLLIQCSTWFWVA